MVVWLLLVVVWLLLVVVWLLLVVVWFARGVTSTTDTDNTDTDNTTNNTMEEARVVALLQACVCSCLDPTPTRLTLSPPTLTGNACETVAVGTGGQNVGNACPGISAIHWANAPPARRLGTGEILAVFSIHCCIQSTEKTDEERCFEIFFFLFYFPKNFPKIYFCKVYV